MRVYVRGCPGQGTTWFARVLPCLFANVTFVSQDNKHQGCDRWSVNRSLFSELAHPLCTHADCMHAVIGRHPEDMKHGRRDAERVWEAYYGSWARSNITNAAFFRYDDLIKNRCTAKYSSPSKSSRYTSRPKRCLRIHDHYAWSFWNYTNHCPGDP